MPVPDNMAKSEVVAGMDALSKFNTWFMTEQHGVRFVLVSAKARAVKLRSWR